MGTLFTYHSEILADFPGIHAGVIHTTRLANTPSSPPLLAEYRAEQAAALQRLDDQALADLPSIGAWRRAFSHFGAECSPA